MINFLKTTVDLTASLVPGANLLIGDKNIKEHTAKLEKVDAKVSEFAKSIISDAPPAANDANVALSSLDREEAFEQNEVFKGICEKWWVFGVASYVIYSLATSVTGLFSKPRDPVQLLSDVINKTDEKIKDKTFDIKTSARQEVLSFYRKSGIDWKYMSNLESSLRLTEDLESAKEFHFNESEVTKKQLNLSLINLIEMERSLEANEFLKAKEKLTSLSNLIAKVSTSEIEISHVDNPTMLSLTKQVDDIEKLKEKKENLVKAKGKLEDEKNTKLAGEKLNAFEAQANELKSQMVDIIHKDFLSSLSEKPVESTQTLPKEKLQLHREAVKNLDKHRLYFKFEARADFPENLKSFQEENYALMKSDFTKKSSEDFYIGVIEKFKSAGYSDVQIHDILKQYFDTVKKEQKIQTSDLNEIKRIVQAESNNIQTLLNNLESLEKNKEEFLKPWHEQQKS